MGSRLEDHLLILKGLCSLRKNKKHKTWLAFRDVSKAFDTVNRDKLFQTLWNKGIQGKAWRLVHGLYEKVENKVIFGPYESEWYEVLNGVKQGCIMSPTIFSIVMSDLEDMLLEQDVGIPYHNKRIPALFYADDIVLMAENDMQLQSMLDVANEFVVKWGMKFNDVKSKVMVIGKRIDKGKRWRLGSLNLTECETYKYLGVFFTRSLVDRVHVSEYLKPKAQ